MSKKKKTPLIESGLRFTRADTADEFARMAADDPSAFIQRAKDFIDAGDLRWGDFHDLKRMFHSLIDVGVEVYADVLGQERAVMASAFPVLSGALTVAGVNDAFDAVPTIGQELVTEDDNNKKTATYVAITSEDTTIDTVKEGDDFPEIGAGEESFEIRHKRNGRRLSITGETIEENDLSNIVRLINALGEIAGEFIEEQTLSRVTDHDGSASSPVETFVYRPNGTGTALFSASANTPGKRAPSGTRVNSNPLVNETDLDNARAVLAAMLNYRLKGVSIPINQATLLVPDALVGTADKILGSEMSPGVENELNPWGPRGRWRPSLLSSTKLDDLSTSAWYLGIPRKQFIRKWKLRIENVTLGMTTESFLKSRIAFQARVAWDVEIGATDFVYWVQNLAATTAPADE